MFDVLYTNGIIHTQDPQRPLAQALGIHHGRVISLDHELEPRHFAKVVDLGGAAVVPGFNDAHLHLTFIGDALTQVDLRPESVKTMEELLAAVDAAASTAKPGAWVIGTGYDQNFLGDEHPTARALDSVSHGHPVFLWHVSRHMAVANTRAFELSGYPERRNVPVPDGGAVPCDARGLAEGLLQETARSIVLDHIPVKSIQDVADLVAAGSREMLKLGVTSITEPGIGAPDHIGQSSVDLAGYQMARERGQLGVRATLMPYLTTLHPLDTESFKGHQRYGLDLGMRSGMGDEVLRIGPTKVLSDGSLIGRSAFMCCDYATDEGNRGLLQFSQETLREKLIGAHLAGWQLAVHAIGDAALDVVMDIIAQAQELAPRPNARHRIEHASVASDAQIQRMVQLGLIPVPQGRFIHELGDGVAVAMGAERQPLAYRVKSFLDAGLVIPGSTDAPVVSADPLLNIASLVERTTLAGAPFTDGEKLTVAQAVHAYTVGSAHAVHEESYKGKLVPGHLADFVVLSQDIYDIPTEDIANTRVEATVVAGELVYGNL
ncbi:MULTISPECIES: amidohydrolase [Glutamicibacter]|uniref:Amidohydrolase n=1 Tax=Glutamicibacter creatinolyticus TaxID=162496 RepID=A0A5B7WYX9_9MICC|nr:MULTISPECIES: amidohydrolase [Glutamicibacter]QCY48363.1 Amidohydrolase [Glutamicibacter creatinolyticus]TLK48377.1 amidohydrolase [Glutamicibacter sp. V16R2B1]